jgi:hypothetical protein
MKKYFVLLCFIFAASNSGAESFLEMTKRKLEEAKKSLAQPQVAQPQVAQPQVEQPQVAQPQVAQPQVAQPQVAQPQVAQPQVAQPQVAQPQVAQPKDATSYCDTIINSAEIKNYTDKYELILSRGSALTSMGVNISLQKLLNSAFMRGADDDLFSRSDALVRRINQAIPKQGEYAEDLNKEVVLEKYLPWFSQCATKLKDSSLRYIFLDPGAPSGIINKFYSSSNEEKINLLRTSWKGGPMVGTRMNDRIFKENTGFQPRGINPYWVTPLLFAVSKGDPNLTPATSQQIARLDKVIADLDSRIVTQQALQKQKADDKEKELARLEKEKEAEAKRLEELNNQAKQSSQSSSQNLLKEVEAKRLDESNSQAKQSSQTNSQNLLQEFKGKWCTKTTVVEVPKFDYMGIKPGDLCLLPEEFLVALLNDANSNKFDLINYNNLEIRSLVIKERKFGEYKIKAMQLLYDFPNSKVYLTSLKAHICAADENNSLAAGNSFRNALEVKFGKPSAEDSEYIRMEAKINQLEEQNNKEKKRVLTTQEAKANRSMQDTIDVSRNLLKQMNRNEIAVINWDYYPPNRDGKHMVSIEAQQNPSLCGYRQSGFELSITPSKAMWQKMTEADSAAEASIKLRQSKAPTPKL